jgi:hypothetical protein
MPEATPPADMIAASESPLEAADVSNWAVDFPWMSVRSQNAHLRAVRVGNLLGDREVLIGRDADLNEYRAVMRDGRADQRAPVGAC